MIDEARYQKLERIKLNYHPTISEDEIKEALSAPVNEAGEGLKGEKEKAKREMFKLIGLVIGAVALILVFAVAFNITLIAGISGCILGLLILVGIPVVLLRIREIDKGSKQESPQTVAEKFYTTTSSIQEMFSQSDAVIAFQLLTPTVAKRATANSIETLKSVWAATNKEMAGKLVGFFNVPNLTLSRTTPQIATLPPKNENVVPITCEYYLVVSRGTLGSEAIGAAKLQFNNIAVRMGDKWYLMAGEPGEIRQAN